MLIVGQRIVNSTDCLHSSRSPRSATGCFHTWGPISGGFWCQNRAVACSLVTSRADVRRLLSWRGRDLRRGREHHQPLPKGDGERESCLVGLYPVGARRAHAVVCVPKVKGALRM